MAIDVTVKAVNLCRRLRLSSTKIMEAIEELAALKDEKESAGINFTDVAIEAALAATNDLKHADGTDFNNVLSSGAAIKTFAVSGHHDDIFAKVRP